MSLTTNIKNSNPVTIPVEFHSQSELVYNFRYKKAVTESDIALQVAREGLAHFLTHGLSDEALSKGWDINKVNSKEHVSWNEKFQELIKPLLVEFIRGVGLERAYGHCLFALIDTKEKLVTTPRLRVFLPKDYKLELDEFGNIVSATARENVLSLNKIVEYKWSTDDELKNIFHSVNRPSEKRGQGRSYLEPVWDDIVSLNILKENTGLFIIRNGAGRLIVTVPEDLYNNSDFMDSIRVAMARLNSANTCLFIPMDISGAKPVVESAMSSHSFSVKEFKEIYTKSISVYSGVPSGRLEGIDQNYASATKNELSYFDVLQNIQKQNIDEVKWITKRIQEVFIKNADSKWEVVFRVREELTEQGRLELYQRQMDLLIKLMSNKELISIDLKEAKKMVGLEYVETSYDTDTSQDSEDDSESNIEDDSQLPDPKKKGLFNKIKDKLTSSKNKDDT